MVPTYSKAAKVLTPLPVLPSNMGIPLAEFKFLLAENRIARRTLTLISVHR